MKRLKSRLLVLTALLLSLAMILPSCALLPLLQSMVTPAEVSFHDMTYERPSYDDLRALADEVLDALEEGASYMKVTRLLNEFFTAFSTFYTMNSLANIHYSADTQDETYLAECNYFTEHAMLVELCREEVLVACAESKIADRLEKMYFLESLEDFRGYARYTNPEYLELAKQEARLIEEYRTTISGAEIDGELFFTALEQATSAEEYNRLLTAFYTQYTPTVTDLYNRMITLRKEMARVAGYDTYIELAAEGLGRDFEPAKVRDYLDELKTVVSENLPEIDAALIEKVYRECGENELYELLSALCTELDEKGETELFKPYYDTMRRNSLSDISYSPNKENASFTAYLYDYYEPYILINPSGTLSDITTLYHEFGHFCDMYYTYNATVSVDLAEVYSTGLEMLALHYIDDMESDLTNEEIEALIAYEEAMVFETLQGQGILASFEMALYDPDSTVDTSDPDALRALYREVANEWGYRIDETNLVSSSAWIAVPHIFQYPSYVFSYCVSMDVALQLYNMEQEEEGAGLNCYLALLNRDTDADFLTVLADAELDSPFAKEHVEALITAFSAKEAA